MKELTIQLQDKALKKLKALAELAGPQAFEIVRAMQAHLETSFSEYMDELLSREIQKQLAILDGRPIPEDEEVVEGTSPADPGYEDPSGHSLSGDADDEPAESLAEQYEAEAAKQQQAPAPRPVQAAMPAREEIDPIEQLFNINAPDAGEDAEAFLDGALGAPSYRDEYDAAPKKAPTPARRGVKKAATISGFDGYEENTI